MSSLKYFLVSILSVFLINALISNGQLTPTFYDKICPSVSKVIENFVKDALRSDPRIAASLIRLHFHDCFVQGCDGSILLDNSPSIASEKDAVPNKNSARGFELIDKMKAALEKACPRTVSCSDILTIAAEKGVTLSGGPAWRSRVGRRDGRTANQDLAENLPSPFETLDELKAKFAAFGLHSVDLVALSGAHTFGKGQCLFVHDRLYNFQNTGAPDPSLDKTYLKTLRGLCPQGKNLNALVNLDITTPNAFDNKYYSNLVGGKVLFQSDHELVKSPSSDTIKVAKFFSTNQTAFFERFAISMVRLANVQVLTGDKGEIRSNCRVVNKAKIIESNHNDDLVSSI